MDAKRTTKVPHPGAPEGARREARLRDVPQVDRARRGVQEKHKTMPFSGVCAAYGCHAGFKPESSCNQCHHSLQATPAEWKTEHPKTVREIGPNACLESCHDGDQCRLCHTTGKTPVFTGLATKTGLRPSRSLHEKADWIEQHGTQALADKPKCLVCHVSEGECNDCHSQRPAFHGSRGHLAQRSQGPGKRRARLPDVPREGLVHRVSRPVQGDALGERERRADAGRRRRHRPARQEEPLEVDRWRPGASRRVPAGVPAALLDAAAGLLRPIRRPARPHGELAQLDARQGQLCRVPREPGPVGFLTFAAQVGSRRSTRRSSRDLPRTTFSACPTRKRVRSATPTIARSRPRATCSFRTAHTSQVLKMNCAECHKDLVHSENDQGFNRPEMNTCTEKCHNGKTATNECIKCHTQKQTPDSHKRRRTGSRLTAPT